MGLKKDVDMGKMWPCMTMLRREGSGCMEWCRERKVEVGM